MTGILLVCFGTTREEARLDSVEALYTTFRENYPALRVTRAYTSPTVRRVLAERGIEVPGVEEALREMAEAGVSDLVVQPGHLLYGDDYRTLETQLLPHRAAFHNLLLAKPLLAGIEDLRSLAWLLAGRYPAEEASCFVWVGHGSETFANCVYPALQTIFWEQGRTDVLVGTVSAYPDCETVLRQIQRAGYRKVQLMPLMLTAGDHAVHDIAGEATDSWRSRLQEAGLEVSVSLKGLGSMASVRALYLRHTDEALEKAGYHVL